MNTSGYKHKNRYSSDQRPPISISNLPVDPSNDSFLHSSTQTIPKEESSLRLQVLALICLSAFGYSFTDTMMNKPLPDFVPRQELIYFIQDLVKAKGLALLFPLVAGLMIYFFQVNRTYQFLVGLSAVGITLIAFGIENANKTLFLAGETSFYATASGLWVVQTYMIIKWFKGKELSFALATLYFADVLAGNPAASLYAYLKINGFASHLYVSIAFSFLAVFAVCFLNKLDTRARAEEAIGGQIQAGDDKSFRENFRSLKASTWVIIAAIFCFFIADYSPIGLSLSSMIIGDAPESSEILDSITTWNTYLSIILFPAFGYLADMTRKRIPMMFVSFIVFSLANLCFFLSYELHNLFLLRASFIPICVARILFQVSAWACLGLSMPRKIFAIILSFTFAVASLIKWQKAYALYFGDNPSIGLVCVLSAGVLVIGMVLVMYIWRVDRGRKNSQKIDYAENKNEEKEGQDYLRI